MASVSSLGTGSGLDLSGLLTSLMTAESQPLYQLQKKEASYQTKISAYGSLQGVLASLQTAAEGFIPSTGTTLEQKFSTFSASVSDTTYASASAASGAVAGSYSLEVLSVAQAQRLVTGQGVYTNGASSTIGTGDLTIEFGTLAAGAFTSDSTRKTTITIDSTNNTLGGLRDAINKANIGATATIVTGTSGSQLVLTSKNTGLSNVMKLSGTGTLTGFDYGYGGSTLSTPASYTAGTDVVSAGGATLSLDIGSLSGSTYTKDGRSKSLTIAAGATLDDVASAITGAGISGVSASVVQDSTSGKYKLVVSNSSSSADDVVRLSGLTGFDFDPAAGTGTLTQATTHTGSLSESSTLGGQTASNAKYTLNGVIGTSSTNTVTGALDGVTLTLSKKTTTATTLTVSQNKTASLTSAVTAFVQAFNTAATQMKSLGAYDASSKTAAALQGNATLRTAQSQVRNLLFGTYSSGTYQNLSNIGITLGKDGKLTLDSSKLSTAITADFNNVASLVSAAGTAFKTTLTSISGTSGSIASAIDGANRVVKSLTKQQEALQTRLKQVEARYRKQFTALDTTISGMKQTSTYLSQQLSSLANLTSSN